MKVSDDADMVCLRSELKKALATLVQLLQMAADRDRTPHAIVEEQLQEQLQSTASAQQDSAERTDARAFATLQQRSTCRCSARTPSSPPRPSNGSRRSEAREFVVGQRARATTVFGSSIWTRSAFSAWT